MAGFAVNLDHMITLIEERPMLWDKADEDYKSRHLKTTAWHEICVILIENFERLPLREQNKKGKALIKKWTSEREKYIKWRRRHQNQLTGSDENIVKKPPYFEQLQFLDKIIEPMNRRASSLESSETKREQATTPLAPELFMMPANNSIRYTERYVPPPKKKRLLDKFEVEMTTAAVPPPVAPPTTSASESPLLSFFRGIIPALEEFTVDEHLQFQIEVLNVIQRMKREKSKEQPTRI